MVSVFTGCVSRQVLEYMSYMEKMSNNTAIVTKPHLLPDSWHYAL